ncbi:cation:proton antiporter [Aquisalimonas sp.]|uniref:cation:proton antiporter domain-containing protein n=1 Tax=Aquisalimonas sp. TaxID=1872621 RepID=UPI0025BCE167|nr:cation:proton antiporter [Aquisalimonas sp.]
MSEFYIAITVIGASVLLLALVSRPIERTPLAPPLVMMLIGIALGPVALDLLDPAQWGNPYLILEEAARITLAIAVMGIALRLPRGFVLREWQTLAVLLCLVMPLMWLVSGLSAYWIFEVSLLVALLLGATLAPTDPVVATSVVTGSVAKKNLPKHVRHTISAESGSNDGLAYLLLMLPILLLTRPEQTALRQWLVQTLLVEIAGAVVLGVLLGLLAGYFLERGEDKENLERSSFLGYTLALTLLALGVAKLVHVEEILTVFVTGLAFDHLVRARERAEEENVQEAVNSFFTLPVFALFGLMLPWEAWYELGWKGLLLAVTILFLRRLPAVLLVYRFAPLIEKRDAWLVGWFGPLGLAALFYATLAMKHTDEGEFIWATTTLLVFTSVLVHGLTASPLAKQYGRKFR